jgi:hypothetical protein
MSDRVLGAVTSCGCGLLFLWVGLLPLLALLNILPHDGFSGGQSSLMPVLGSLPFAAVGLYFLANAVVLLASGRHLPSRLLFTLGMFFLAIPFHYWLFFGKAGEGSTTGISLPGGFLISFFDNSHLSFMLGKIAMAFLLVIIDLYLVSEFLGLGWFRLVSDVKEDVRKEDDQ